MKFKVLAPLFLFIFINTPSPGPVLTGVGWVIDLAKLFFLFLTTVLRQRGREIARRWWDRSILQSACKYQPSFQVSVSVSKRIQTHLPPTMLQIYAIMSSNRPPTHTSPDLSRSQSPFLDPSVSPWPLHPLQWHLQAHWSHREPAMSGRRDRKPLPP